MRVKICIINIAAFVVYCFCAGCGDGLDWERLRESSAGNGQSRVSSLSVSSSRSVSSSSSPAAAQSSIGGGQTTIPGAPASVYTSETTMSSVKVSWNPVAGAAIYNVFYMRQTGDPAPIFAAQVSASPYTCAGLQADTAYVFYVQAVNTAGESPLSNSASARTLAAQSSSGGQSSVGISSSSSSSAAGLAMEMVYIAPGAFVMGSPGGETGRNSDETLHLVTLTKGFYMGKYEVTQAQYKELMIINPSYFYGTGRPPASGEVQEKRPVETVSWYDALVFCNKLSMRDGLTPVYSIKWSENTDPASWGEVPTSSNTDWNAVSANWNANGYRLPTEAEWEYACRAGTETVYNTGDTISNSTGWYSSNSDSKTHEVGKKPPNAWGLYDMHGNVWEWVWDWYGSSYYSASGAGTDPKGLLSGSLRVFRGGSWYSGAQFLRSAYRGSRYYVSNYFDYYPYNRRGDFGFRLARNQ